jgi:hypothetical protein
MAELPRPNRFNMSRAAHLERYHWLCLLMDEPFAAGKENSAIMPKIFMQAERICSP